MHYKNYKYRFVIALLFVLLYI